MMLISYVLINNNKKNINPSFHTEDNRETHLQLLQKIQTLTDAPEGKTMH